MNYKRIASVFLFSSITFLTSCEKEQVDRIQPHHRSITTSNQDFENRVQVGGKFTFGDFSQGLANRTWKFPSNAFDVIGSENDTVSTAQVVEVLGKNAGIYEVKLSQVFNQKPFLDGNTVVSDTIAHDTLFNVEVLDSIRITVPKANFLNADGTLGDELSLTETNQLEGGNSVRYFYDVIGLPDQVTLDPDGATFIKQDAFEQFFDVKYKTLKTFDVLLEGTRGRPSGLGELEIEKLIEVIPSEAPVLIDETYTLDGKVYIVFSRDIEPSSIVPEQFSLKVQNRRPSVNVTTSNFESIGLDKDDASILVVEPKADEVEIFDNDQVTLIYTAPMAEDVNKLKAADNKVLETFEEKKISANLDLKENLLDAAGYDFGFENSTDVNKNFPNFTHWADLYSENTVELTKDFFRTGKKSLKISVRPGGGAIRAHLKDGLKEEASENNFFRVKLEPGKYTITYWIYIEEHGDSPFDAPIDRSDFRLYANPKDLDISEYNGSSTIFNVEETPQKVWIEKRTAFTIDETVNYGLVMRALNQKGTAESIIFIDDLSIKKDRLRE